MLVIHRLKIRFELYTHFDAFFEIYENEINTDFHAWDFIFNLA